MVKRTTISIPDELHLKMEKYKGNFNYSKEFQMHISGLIEKKENYQLRLKGEGQEMDQIIERLRDEKIKSTDKWDQRGKDDGLRWAKAAPYDDLQFALEWDFSMPPHSKSSSIGDELMSYINDQSKEYDGVLIDDDQYSEEWLTEAGETYIEAWHQAVTDFWDEVKGKL